MTWEATWSPDIWFLSTLNMWKIYERSNKSAMFKKFPNEAQRNNFISNQNLPPCYYFLFLLQESFPNSPNTFLQGSKLGFGLYQLILTAAMYSHGFDHYTIIFGGRESLRVMEKKAVQLIINQNLRLLSLDHSFGAPSVEIHFPPILCVFP